MMEANAQVLLEIKKVSHQLLQIKSQLSHDILLTIASYNGTCDLRILFKKIEATPAAIRLHVQGLEDEGYVYVCTHQTNRRCKVACLTDKGLNLMRGYEREIQNALNSWQTVQSKI